MSEVEPGLSREEVVLGYRLMLGRLPESEQVIEAHRSAHASLEAFGLAIRASEEFRERLAGGEPHRLPPLDAPPLEAETAADAQTLARLLGHVAGYWSQVGRSAPHWSVLTEERFLPERFAEHRAAFFASGEWDAQVLDATLARAGRMREEFVHCVEYGCGVGRATVALAVRFARVTGLDVSRPHLDLARQELAGRGIANVRLAEVTPAALMPAEDYDLWYSHIVLQHNPPPVVMAILRRAFLRLRPGGMAVFQVPTWIEGYRFRTAEYLAATPGAEMEMHAVPQAAILELAAAHGLVLRDLREDNDLAGRPGKAISNRFAFEKRG
ncbi:MAG: class I SAM-dependent methyltransferase [Roseococcus sp.]|nr:class I SAM-dependent methyltransferase [Roseococcus sp.]